MRWGISGDPVPDNLPYAHAINRAFMAANLSPLFGYAVASVETISGEVNGSWNAATVISGDGGHGLFQLTFAYPHNWQDPEANAAFAVDNWFTKAEAGGFPLWTAPPYNLTGEPLVKCVAASWNAGPAQAIQGHDEGDVDKYTAGGDYGERVLQNYLKLAQGKAPWE